MKTYLRKTENNDVFDAINEFFKPMFYDEHLDSMRTDICETETGYELSIELPGYQKSEIKVNLNDGYLTVAEVGRACRGPLHPQRMQRLLPEKLLRRRRRGAGEHQGAL